MNHNQASSLDYQEVAKVLETDITHGLNSFEARERLKKYGINQLEEVSEHNTVSTAIFKAVKDYLSQFMNPLIQLLMICIIVSAAIQEYENAISISVSVLIVCTISYIQERRADKSLEKLNKQMPSICRVLRDGRLVEIEANLIVPGDIIYLSEGQRVPADARLFELQSLTVNESNLTGETQSQPKIASPTGYKLIQALNGISKPSEDMDFIFQNLALMGTTIESGNSRGIVICTGKSTRYGQVFSMLKTTVQPKSPLQMNIDQLSLHLVVISCTVIALVSIMGIIQHRPALQVAYYAISLAVTAIPEGLPVVVAVIMALGVLRLSQQKTIVKSLSSIETLGCIQVLCADKTGTLTRTDMTMTDIVTSELHALSCKELEDMNREECRQHMTFNKFGGKMYSIGRIMEVGTLCNNASIDPSPAAGFIGQATDCAILDASMRLGFGDSRTKFDRLEEIPFSSVSRRMIVKCQRLDFPGNSPMYYVKGAWEEVLEDCANYYEAGLVKPRTDAMWLEYKRTCGALGGHGLRVLAMAMGPTLDQLTFVGVVGINNAVRDGIAATLSQLRDEFMIDTKMITGDSKDTALAVAKELGIVSSMSGDEERDVMSGEQVQRLLESEMEELTKAAEINSKSVFYRVDPVQKANIIGKLQELDLIVAMTGDGINDVVSLKRANLSLAMGSGADVCKEVADVVMVDNDLSVLANAVIEGKGIYHKIHSFMSYQITISLSLLLLVAASFATKTDPPFTIIQLLFINILADGPPAQSLGLEQVPKKELAMHPRNIREPILSCRLIGTLMVLTTTMVGINGALYYALLVEGRLDDHSRTLLFTCFVMCSIFAVLSLRSKVKTVFEQNALGNKGLFTCCFLIVAILMAIINFKPLNYLFDVRKLPHVEIIYVFLYSSLVLVVMDTVKVIVRLVKYSKSLISDGKTIIT